MPEKEEEKPTSGQEDPVQYISRYETISGLITSSLENGDTDSARNFAEELHNLETRITLQRHIEAMHRRLNPIRITMNICAGAAIGTSLMIMTDTNVPLNTQLMTVAAAGMTTAALSTLITQNIGRRTSAQIIRAAKERTRIRVANIIAQHQQKIKHT